MTYEICAAWGFAGLTTRKSLIYGTTFSYFVAAGSARRNCAFTTAVFVLKWKFRKASRQTLAERGSECALLRSQHRMAERRLISLDGWVVGFAALGIAVTLCVVSYDPDSASNWVGEPGHGLARELTDALGQRRFRHAGRLGHASHPFDALASLAEVDR